MTISVLQTFPKRGSFIGKHIDPFTGSKPQKETVMSSSDTNNQPSDTLFEGIDLDLLSHSEQIELSHLAEIIDLGGDVTALSTAAFERLKHILNKGRGKDITPR
jgi:hypothetical protein